MVYTSSSIARPGGCSDCSSGDARRDLLRLVVGREARGRAWPDPVEAVLDYGCLEASKDAAVAGSRVQLDVVVEDVHECGGGVAVKPDSDLIGVHPRQRIPRQCPTATNTPCPYAPNPPSERRGSSGGVLDQLLPGNQGGSADPRDKPHLHRLLVDKSGERYPVCSATHASRLATRQPE